MSEPKQCGYCSSKAKLMCCAGCKSTKYCSRQCQILDWPTHQQNCKKSEKKDGGTSNSETNSSAKTGMCTACGCLCPIKTCSLCKTEVYCSRDCQRADWVHHKRTCMGRPMNFMRSPYVTYKAPRPPGSLQTAKELAAQKFAGCRIVDSFDDLGGEYSRERKYTILVAFMFQNHTYFIRHGMYLKDRNDAVTHVMFYIDDDDPTPFFSWEEIVPGNYICLRGVFLSHLLNGENEIIIDNARDVRVISL